MRRRPRVPGTRRGFAPVDGASYLALSLEARVRNLDALDRSEMTAAEVELVEIVRSGSAELAARLRRQLEAMADER